MSEGNKKETEFTYKQRLPWWFDVVIMLEKGDSTENSIFVQSLCYQYWYM